MSNKARFASKGQDMASIFANLADDLSTWRNVFWDRAYNAGGADELTDADVEALGIDAATATGLVTFADALDTFMAANRGYLSKMRNDL